MKQKTTHSDTRRAEAASILALQALAFLVSDPEHLQRLTTLSGLDLQILRDQANEPNVQAGILDYLLADEAALLAFCQETGHDPAQPKQLRRWLPGGIDE